MSYEETLRFIEAASWRGSSLGLKRMTELMRRLGDPQKRLKYVHVAGTNGKGSTCAMLAAVLSAAGYRTGLYTSPHLRVYNERMKIDGADIPDEEMGEAAEEVRRCVDGMEDVPTEFERVTAMAFVWFARRKCDVVVLEVGLGGRLDATNVIDAPELAVITNIGLEHTEILGDTLEKIAAEKAGVIKPGASALLYQQSAGVEAVVRERCDALGCPLRVTDAARERLISRGLDGQTLSYRGREHLTLRLLGTYQYRNAALVLDAVDALRERGWHIPEEAIRRGFANATWPARFEVLRREPLVLLDGAHNPQCAEELARCLADYLPGKKLTLVMGVMADKDYGAMAEAMAPHAGEFITVTPDYCRALPSDELARAIESRVDVPVRDGGSVRDGIALALRRAAPDDAICVFGSLYQAGEARQAIL